MMKTSAADFTSSYKQEEGWTMIPFGHKPMYIHSGMKTKGENNQQKNLRIDKQRAEMMQKYIEMVFKLV